MNNIDHRDIIHKELDLIQGVITRMASNSFEVKKWLIGILTAIVVFKNEELLGNNPNMVWILLFPILCFWYMDAFFLSTERLYRELYKWVINNRSNTDAYLYDLNTMVRSYDGKEPVNLIKKNNRTLRVAFSNTLLPFYLVPVVFIIALWAASYFKGCGCGHLDCLSHPSCHTPIHP